MPVLIASGLLSRILAHAATEPAREACGLLLGIRDEITDAVPTANVADRPADSFEIDPAALFAAHRAARAGGPAMIGHYHSHPGGSCEPSRRDAAAAVPGQLWLIVAGSEAALFHVEPDGGFARQTMINAPAPGCESLPHSSEGRRA